MIKIGGFVPFTTIDFPGKMATVLFCQGCSLKCPYCHNAHLRSFTDIYEDLSWKELVGFLLKRRKMVDAVVFSGGEPLFQHDLLSAVTELKDLSFAVALHTSGADFPMLDQVYEHLDFIAMDFKLPYEEYDAVYNRKEHVLSSLRKITSGNVSYEIRTTLDPALLSPDKVIAMAEFLRDNGVKHYAVQKCRGTENYNVDPVKASVFFDNRFRNALQTVFPKVVFRQ